MNKKLTTALVAGLILPLASMTSGAQATNIGNEGCTPGYWKNHTDNWFEAPGDPISTNMTLAETGLVPFDHEFADTTLLEALNFRPRGDAEMILLRTAAAAWLNAAHEGLGYPYRRAFDSSGSVETNLTRAVRNAIVSGDRRAQLSLKDVLDAANNLGCPLN